MNLNDFIENNPNPKVKDLNNMDEQTKKEAEDTAKELFDKYKDMDQNALMNEFISEVTRQKQQGTFDKNKIINMLNSVKSMIPEQMYNQALSILNSI